MPFLPRTWQSHCAADSVHTCPPAGPSRDVTSSSVSLSMEAKTQGGGKCVCVSVFPAHRNAERPTRKNGKLLG